MNATNETLVANAPAPSEAVAVVKEGKKKEGSTVTHIVVDGRLEFTVLGAGKFTFDPAKVSAQNRARAMMHGFVQRISDGAALSRDPETGLPATPESKMARMQRIAAHLESGATEWALRAAAQPKDDMGLIEAGIARALSKSRDEVAAIIEATMAKRGTDKIGALKVWQDSKQVKAAILEIKAERANASSAPSVDDLLAELSGDTANGEGEEAPL